MNDIIPSEKLAAMMDGATAFFSTRPPPGAILANVAADLPHMRSDFCTKSGMPHKHAHFGVTPSYGEP